jgi:hypothetical protein
MSTETINGFTFYYSDTLKQTLTNITRNTGVTSTTITIPNSVTAMAATTFNTNAVAGTDGGVKNIITDFIFEPLVYVGNLSNAGLGNTTVPTASSSLKTVTLGGAITGVGGGIFRSCVGLTRVTIATTDTSNFIFGANCFANCTTLSKININTADISITSNAAFQTTNSTVFLPTSQDFYYRYYKSFAVTGSVSSYAEFGGAPSSANVPKYTVSGNSISVIPTPSSTAGTSFSLIIPDSISSFINTTTPPGVITITKVGSGSVLNSTSLTFITSLSFYSGINTIDANAFSNASNMTALVLSNKPTLLSNCFSGCSSINNTSLQTLRTQSNPYGCRELITAGFTDIQLTNAGYTFIFDLSGSTLTGIIRITTTTIDSITIPASEGGVNILTIGAGVSSTLVSTITSIIISSGITSIEANAFANRSSLTTITLSGTGMLKPNLASGCFTSCSNINNTSLQALKNTNLYGGQELMTAGFTDAQLVTAGYDYIFNISGSILTGITRVSTIDSITIPETDGGFRILTIGAGVSSTLVSTVTSIIISSGITSIESNAFANRSSLTTITLSGKPTLGSNCFTGCDNIDTNSLQALRTTNSYDASQLKTAGFSVSQLGTAGYSSSEIYSAGFDDSQLVVAGYNFIFNVSNVNVLTSITRVTGSTLTALTIPTSDGGVNILTIGTGVSSTLISNVTSIIISSGITSIEANAFANRSSLTTITLSGKPTLLSNCFNGCDNIDTNSLQALRTTNSYLSNELQLAGFSISQLGNAGYSSSEIFAAGFDNSQLVDAGYNFIFNISNANVLTSITRVTGSTLTALTIPTSDGGVNILTIGTGVSSTLVSTVTSIIISSGITSIESNAFANRSSLTTITLLSNPTLLENCFTGCDNIDTNSLQALRTTNSYNASQLRTAGFTISQLKSAGYNDSEILAAGFNDSQLVDAGYNFIFNISNANVLTSITRLTGSTINSITIPTSDGGVNILTIGTGVSSTLVSTVTSIIISSGITSIEANAFANRSSLTTITLLDNPILGSNCFNGCDNIDITSLQALRNTNLYTGRELRTAGFTDTQLTNAGYTFIFDLSGSALTSITRLTTTTINSITIPASDGGVNILTIGTGVSSTLVSTITSIIISSGITSIEANAFANRSSLTTITLSGNPTLLENCFTGCDNIDVTSLQALRNTNSYSSGQLKTAGFSVSQLGTAGYSSSEIYSAGFTDTELINSGYDFIFNISNANVLTSITRVTGSTLTALTIPTSDGGVNILTIGTGVSSTLVSTVTSIIISSGITSIEVNAFANRSSLTTITLLGNPLLDSNCFTGCDNIDANSLQALKNTNSYSSGQLKTAGFSVSQLGTAGYNNSEIFAAGFDNSQLVDAGYNFIFNISNLNVLTSITRITGSTLTALTIPTSEDGVNIFTVGDGTVSVLTDVASVTTLIVSSGITTISSNAFLNTTTITSLSLPDKPTLGSNCFTGCANINSDSLQTLRTQSNSYSSGELKTAGFTASQLKEAGYSAADLKNAGFTAFELLVAGYDEQTVINLFSTTTGETYVPCFNENTKILCLVDGEEKELLVQNIRNGVLVKTLVSGYLPVCMIGTKKIYNPGNNQRTTERLYICKKEMYPELNQDLIITGCHSILVDEFTDIQREKTLEKFNDIFITDDKYRLIAAFDERAEPYNHAGEFNIYHFALENENYFYNYGIYANGLLVETCSKRYLKEKTDMTLL